MTGYDPLLGVGKRLLNRKNLTDTRFDERRKLSESAFVGWVTPQELRYLIEDTRTKDSWIQEVLWEGPVRCLVIKKVGSGLKKETLQIRFS